MAKSNTKKRKREFKLDESKKALAKRILTVTAVLIAILVVYLFFRNLHYFKLKEIEVAEISYPSGIDTGELLKLYKDRNIFDININALSSRIRNEYPVIKDAVVRRVLPDKLEIDIIPRRPVAKIKAQAYFPIDMTGMVLPPGMENADLPIIMGLSGWIRPHVGERLKNNQLKSAFSLIEALEEMRVMSDHRVSAIDVSNHKNLSFYFENGIEVKIGDEDFLNRLKKVKAALNKPNFDAANVRYIDVRFKGYVLGAK